MSEIKIRPYQAKDKSAIIDIAFKTGFTGEDLAGRGYCEDARLWYLLFIAYYNHYEPEHFFVAVEAQNDKVVGFICGTPDTLSQEKNFKRLMVIRIMIRLFGYTSWRYPRSFKNVLGMLRWVTEGTKDADNDPIIAQYPGHLHINLLPGFQSQGTGTRLIQHFEMHMSGLGLNGIHLGTTSKNHKAVPFYHKMGFDLIEESDTVPHPAFGDVKFLMFAKSLEAKGS